MKFLLTNKFIVFCSLAAAPLLLTLWNAVAFDAFGSGFSGSDEAAHFINSYFVWSFLGSGSLDDPMGYARDFYASYPKLSIGHWPPAYYFVAGLFFFIAPATPAAAMVLNCFVTTAVAVLIGYFVRQVAAWPWAIAAGAIYVAMPLTIYNVWFFMLDQPLALVCLAAGFIWLRFARAPSYRLAIAYAAVASAGILLKGNGWLLALFPVFCIVIGRQWHLLRIGPSYVAGLLALAAVGPWYWLTSEISADGFNYQFGAEYALKAATAILYTLKRNLGTVGVSLAILGTILPFTSSPKGSVQRQVALTAVSMILATLALQSLVPVDLTRRYAVPALPFALTLSVIGMSMLTEIVPSRWPKPLPLLMAISCVIALLIPGYHVVRSESPQRDMRMAEAVDAALAGESSQIVVIDGSPGGEGSFISEVLSQKPTEGVTVIRSSMLLSRSNFMGSVYELTVSTNAALREKLSLLGAKSIVVERIENGPLFPHNDLLLEFLNSADTTYRQIARLKHRNRNGETMVFEAIDRVSPNPGMARKINFPDKQPKF